MIARNCDWFIALFVPVVIGGVIALVLVFRLSFENCSIISLLVLSLLLLFQILVSSCGDKSGVDQF